MNACEVIKKLDYRHFIKRKLINDDGDKFCAIGWLAKEAGATVQDLNMGEINYNGKHMAISHFVRIKYPELKRVPLFMVTERNDYDGLRAVKKFICAIGHGVN